MSSQAQISIKTIPGSLGYAPAKGIQTLWIQFSVSIHDGFCDEIEGLDNRTT
jgi:hypothetical protein